MAELKGDTIIFKILRRRGNRVELQEDGIEHLSNLACIKLTRPRFTEKQAKTRWQKQLRLLDLMCAALLQGAEKMTVEVRGWAVKEISRIEKRMRKLEATSEEG